jgi:hypothetical protein
MATIYDHVYYEKSKYEEVKDQSAKDQIMSVANRLLPLEDEIVQHPEGRITIKASGNQFIAGFPDDLARKIGNLLK